MSERRDPNSIRKRRVMQVLNAALGRGESRKELADRLDTSEPTLARWLKPGDNEPDPQNIVKIASEMDVPAGWLLGEMSDEERFVLDSLRRPGRSAAGRILRSAVDLAAKEDAIERGVVARERPRTDHDRGGQ